MTDHPAIDFVQDERMHAPLTRREKCLIWITLIGASWAVVAGSCWLAYHLL